jgi:hypothetical protein
MNTTIQPAGAPEFIGRFMPKGIDDETEKSGFSFNIADLRSMVWRQRRERAELVARFRTRQRRNAAQYRAWQWVFGRRKNLQLPDYSEQHAD